MTLVLIYSEILALYKISSLSNCISTCFEYLTPSQLKFVLNAFNHGTCLSYFVNNLDMQSEQPLRSRSISSSSSFCRRACVVSWTPPFHVVSLPAQQSGLIQCLFLLHDSSSFTSLFCRTFVATPPSPVMSLLALVVVASVSLPVPATLPYLSMGMSLEHKSPEYSKLH